jgi:cellulose synthase (UDP-forming)
VGGIGPELNEDFSTSYIMSASGWKGAFSINTIAHGDGPATFEDCMWQEYQWARSATVLLLAYQRRSRAWWPGKLTWAEMIRVINSSIYWYFRAQCAVGGMLSTLLFIICPLLPASTFSFGGFTAVGILIHLLPAELASVASWLLCKAKGWLRPTNAWLISYELILHQLAYGWWILLGILHGWLGVLAGWHFNIKVTPKGDNGEPAMPVSNLLPLLLCAGLAVPSLAFGSHDLMVPSMLFGGLNLAAALAILGLHYRENHRWPRLPWANAARHSALLLPATALYVLLVIKRWPVIAEGFIGNVQYRGSLLPWQSR